MKEQKPKKDTKKTQNRKESGIVDDKLSEDKLKKRSDGDETGEIKVKTSKKKNKGFPLGSLILTLFLCTVTLTAGFFGMKYMNDYNSAKETFDAALKAAEDEKTAAEAVLAEEKPDSAANIAIRSQITAEMIAEANAEIETLQKESHETDESIRAAEEKIAELQSSEGYDFYRSVYDEYVEGRAYVEELLSSD